MFMFETKDPAWWYWLVTAALLTVGVSGWQEGFMLAILLSTIQLMHYILREPKITAFPVQVRFWYLVLLLVCLTDGLQWLYWVPTIGTWAQVLFGYCTRARLVSLWPWNRQEDFSVALLKKTFFSRPVRGNILQGFAAQNK